MICPRTSRAMGFRARSGEAVDKPAGTPDGVQWIRVHEWSVDPLSAIALVYLRSHFIALRSFLITQSHLSSHSPHLRLLSPPQTHARSGCVGGSVCVGGA